MIYDTIQNITEYAGVNYNFIKAVFYLKNLDFASLKMGKNEIDGDTIYINRMSYDTDNEQNRVWESHKEYCDIHCIISGCETIQLADIKSLKITKPYDANSDAILYEGNADYEINMKNGSILICFPHEAHKTGVIYDKNMSIDKFVCKVKIN